MFWKRYTIHASTRNVLLHNFFDSDIEHRWLGDSSEESRPMPIPVLAAFLRLGRKYEIDHIRQQAVKRLGNEFPFEFHKSAEFCTRDGGTITETEKGDYLRLINFIRENELLVHLPMAMLRCIIMDHLNTVSLFFSSPEAQQPILPYTDIETCVKAHTKLQGLQATQIFSWLQPWQRTPSCGKNACIETRRAIANIYLSKVPDIWMIFADWDRLWSQVLCQECDLRAQKEYADAQKKIFEELPSILKLPEWKELREKWSTVCDCEVHALMIELMKFPSDTKFPLIISTQSA